MVTGTYDGQNISIYVDGELDDTRYVGEIIAYTGPAPLMIGSNLNTDHTGRGVFNGPLDEVYIYNRALSEDEVYDLYVVPVPSAFILGVIGIGFAGLKLRKKT
jgi:multisubunit Na+/H+ antiporter MnhC subunit